jgi:hypothetical protein
MKVYSDVIKTNTDTDFYFKNETVTMTKLRITWKPTVSRYSYRN